MPGKKIKKVDGIGQKSLEEAIEEFMRHCRLKNLASATMEYFYYRAHIRGITCGILNSRFFAGHKHSGQAKPSRGPEAVFNGFRYFYSHG